MVYCQKCGTKNAKSAQFCEKCGLSLIGKTQISRESIDKRKTHKTNFWLIVLLAILGIGLLFGIIGYVYISLTPTKECGVIIDKVKIGAGLPCDESCVNFTKTLEEMGSFVDLSVTKICEEAKYSPIVNSEINSGNPIPCSSKLDCISAFKLNGGDSSKFIGFRCQNNVCEATENYILRKDVAMESLGKLVMESLLSEKSSKALKVTESKEDLMLACAQDVIVDLSSACVVAGNNAVRLKVENNGAKDIEKFSVRLYKEIDDVTIDITTLGPLTAFQIYSGGFKEIAIDNANLVKYIELIPSIVVGDKELTCTTAKVYFGDAGFKELLPSCSS